MASKKKKPKKAAPPPAPVAKKPPRAAAQPQGPTRREQERAARAKQQRSDKLRRTVGTIGLVAVVAAVVGGYLLFDRRQDAQLREALTSGSCETDRETDPTGGAGQNHVPSPSYAVNPPAGGNHLASAARAGVYSGPSVPPDGLLVHSLEHGYIVAWHSPDLPAEQKEQLEEFQREHQDDVIVVERANLPVPVAATAWGHRLLCQQVEPAVLERFFEERVGDGPEDVPRG